jgi:hypothetical protein
MSFAHPAPHSAKWASSQSLACADILPLFPARNQCSSRSMAINLWPTEPPTATQHIHVLRSDIISVMHSPKKSDGDFHKTSSSPRNAPAAFIDCKIVIRSFGVTPREFNAFTKSPTFADFFRRVTCPPFVSFATEASGGETVTDGRIGGAAGGAAARAIAAIVPAGTDAGPRISCGVFASGN